MLKASVIIAIRVLFNRNMSIFTQCLNPLTGVASWEEKDQYYDYHQEVARSAFADMLHDHERVSIFLYYYFIFLLVNNTDVQRFCFSNDPLSIDNE